VKHVLVVDDEPFVRDALKRVLEGESVTVQTAEDAEAALSQLRKQLVDVIIIDVIMPGLDGVQLIKRLRAEYPTVRIVAISGGGNFELSGYRPEAVSTRAYLAAATNAGADAALAKPFDTAELEAAVRPLLERLPPQRTLS
jgi:CheY-like chemotaxis protein